MYVFRKKRNIYLVKMFDLIGSILFSLFGLRRFELPERIRRILVIRLDGSGSNLSGDVLLEF